VVAMRAIRGGEGEEAVGIVGASARTVTKEAGRDN